MRRHAKKKEYILKYTEKKLAGRAWVEPRCRIRRHLADAEGQQPEPQMKMQTGPRLEPHEMQERPKPETHGDMRKRPKPEPHGKLPKLGPGRPRATKTCRRADGRTGERTRGSAEMGIWWAGRPADRLRATKTKQTIVDCRPPSEGGRRKRRQ